MKDSLKKFIDEHRQEFDQREPSSHVWTRIKSQLPGKQSMWNNLIVWRVAAMLFLGLSIYLISTRTLNVPTRESARLQGEFSDLENFYVEQIAEKVELISDIQEFSNDEKFVQDLEKLEAMYQVLREQMKTQPSEKIKDALILNLLVRIDLLNQQIKNLEDFEKEKEEQKGATI
jgi:hypothetical protein